jgi:hypothetical protein
MLKLKQQKRIGRHELDRVMERWTASTCHKIWMEWLLLLLGSLHRILD